MTVQLGAVPPMAILALGTLVTLEDTPATLLVHATADSISEMVKGMVAEVISSSVDCAKIVEMIGTSFTALTVRAKDLLVCLAGNGAPKSVRVKVIFNDPF